MAKTNRIISSQLQAPLLAPKLQLPRLPIALIPRERLFALLDRSLERTLTLLCAPAGFGKTTLLLQWMRKRSPSVAWVSLDAGDNDPIRFWRYVIAACQTFRSGETRTPLPMVGLPFSKPISIDTLLTTFLNTLTEMSEDTILVLEDYHVISTPQIHETVNFFLEYLPAKLHLVMLTRHAPPLSLARLRASGQLCELSAADLRFSHEEALAFLEQVAPFPMEEQMLWQLDARLEGWAAGLRLLSLALQGQSHKPDLQRALATLSGGQSAILDYFVSEVLACQPEPLQDFLLRTSILGLLTDSLCNRVMGRSDSVLWLETLERANLFLERLDGSRLDLPLAGPLPLPSAAPQWYRYHALFAEAMKYEACRRLGEEVLRVSSQQASSWYEEQGMLSEAIEAAIIAQDIPRQIRLIEQYSEVQAAAVSMQPFQDSREFHTLYRWLKQLPDEVIRQHPGLCFSKAGALLLICVVEQQPFTLRIFAQIEEALHLAEEGFRHQENRQRLGEIYALRSVIARQEYRIKAATAFATEALTCLPEEEVAWRGMALSVIAAEELLAGHPERARQTALLARVASEGTQNPAILRPNTVLLSWICLEQGELHQVDEYCRQVLVGAREQEDWDDIGDAQLGLAQVSYAWNALQEAESQAQEALAMGRRLANQEFQVKASLILARIEHARGERTRAWQRCVDLLTQLSTASLLGSPSGQYLQREIQATQVRFWLAADDLPFVQRWVNSRDQSAEDLPWLQREREELLVARWLLTQEKSAEALELLGGLRDAAQREGRVRSLLEIQVIMALAHYARNERLEARRQVQATIALAYPEGHQRIFLDEGEAMAPLLQAVLPTVRGKGQVAYIQHLLRALAQERSTMGASSDLARLREPLSTQEQRVLRLLASGHTNPSIARDLVVSVNTVKVQIQSIYRKLNVNNRVAASEVARMLGLL